MAGGERAALGLMHLDAAIVGVLSTPGRAPGGGAA